MPRKKGPAKPEKKRRRGYGEGTVYPRKDGRWCSQISMGTKDGKRDRKTIYGEVGGSKQDLLDQVTKFKHNRMTNSIVNPSKTTVQGFLEHWLEVSAAETVAGSTLDSYTDKLKTHVFPRVGHVLIQKLTPDQIRETLGAMVLNRPNKKKKTPNAKASPRSKNYVYTILNDAFNKAVEWKVISSNPCSTVERPRFEKHEIQPLDEAQAKKFLRYANKSVIGLVFEVLLVTGMRLGELRALKLSDVNFKNGTISIQRTISKTKAGYIEKSPKTSRGRRLITTPKRTMAKLLEIKTKRLKDGTMESEKYLFPGEGDLPLGPDFIRTEFDRILRTAKLPRIRPHDLRHTHATLLFMKGENPKVVQERLGHATIAITIDIYGHVMPNMQAEASRKMEQIFA